MEANAQTVTVHTRICCLLVCIWASLVAVDIAIYVAPGAGGNCPDGPSSGDLRDAFTAVLIAHIVHIYLCSIAWFSSEEIAKLPDGNEEMADLQGHTKTELKRVYILTVYLLLGVAAFISAWVTKCHGYSSLEAVFSNTFAGDCLHGTFRLAWFYSLLWCANIVYLGGLGILFVCGVIGAVSCGHILLQEFVTFQSFKAWRTQQTKSQELPKKVSPVIPESVVVDVSDAAAA